jgi:hypothetical protein
MTVRGGWRDGFLRGVRAEFADLARQYNVAPTSINYVLAKSTVGLGRKAGTEIKTDQQCL